jgi:hypothetical protein
VVLASKFNDLMLPPTYPIHSGEIIAAASAGGGITGIDFDFTVRLVCDFPSLNGKQGQETI